jgi:hypothetical protein
MVMDMSSEDDDSEDDNHNYQYGVDSSKVFKTPLSDRIMMDSSMIYSKSVYPISLGMHDDE